jgi:hypothetical protein
MTRIYDRWLRVTRRRVSVVGLVVGLVLVLVAQPVIGGQQAVSAGGPALQGAPGLDQRTGPVDPPSVRSYPSSDADVQRWIDTFDMVKIRAHGWDLWESITTDAGEGTLPVWETWYSGQEIFGPPPAQPGTLSPRPTFRVFERAHQVRHSSSVGAIPIDQAEQVTAFNRYSTSLANAIVNNGYNQAATLTSINNGFNQQGTPVGQRQISTSAGAVDASQVVLKPVFEFISGSQPTAVSYWAGISPQTTTSLDNPMPSTWRQCVIVDPTGQLPVGSKATLPCNNEPPAEYPVVSLDEFYFFVITKDQADQFSSFAENSGDDLGAGNSSDVDKIKEMVKEGNIALLMAMHTTTKEITNWTWQTFWWAYNPDDPQYGHDRPASIKAPWSHYNMDTAYFMLTPRGGGPWIAFNPYLETNLTGCVPVPGTNCSANPQPVNWTGVHTNCMTCHRMAAWNQQGTNSPTSPPYWPDGFISPDNSALFDGFTKTDFLWSIASRAN